MIDFQRDFGVNAGYVQALYEEWSRDPAAVDQSWRGLFERLRQRADSRAERSAEARPAAPAVTVLERPPAAPEPSADEDRLEPLAGLGARIVENMEQSLEVP